MKISILVSFYFIIHQFFSFLFCIQLVISFSFLLLVFMNACLIFFILSLVSFTETTLLNIKHNKLDKLFLPLKKNDFSVLKYNQTLDLASCPHCSSNKVLILK